MRFLRVVLAASSRRHLSLVASIAAVLVAFPATASATTTVHHYKFSGTYVSAYWENVSDCLDTVGDVWANDGKSTDTVTGHTTSTVMGLRIYGVNNCTGAEIRVGGDVPLSRGQLTIDNKLATATLRATVQLFDFVSDSLVDIDVDLTWTATDDGAFWNKSVNRVTYPDGSMTILRVSGASRDARASGVVSEGGVNLLPTPSFGAYIGATKFGSFSLTR
jgi:hypothetical protein